MKFDDQTLRDLDILPSGINKVSILEIFDHAKTEGGKRRLRKFLLEPLDNFDKIIDRQNSLKYIIENIKNWELFPFTNKLLKDVHRYLSLQIIPTYSFNLIELKLKKIRHNENYFQQRQGILSLRKLLYLFHDWGLKHFSSGLPSNLNDLFVQLKEYLDQDNVKHFLEVSTEMDISTTNLYKFDTFFRDKFLSKTKALLDICFELDILISLAKTIKDKGFNFPIFSKSKTPVFKAEGLCHPFLDNPKCYEINIAKENFFTFLTGPNMAGKTTFLKSCGVAVYLAHLGLAVPSRFLELSIFNSLVSSINTEDNIKLGYSYFYSEVKRVKSIAETIVSNQNAFIILDELFKGTNIHDAYEASKKVIQGFASWNSHIYLLSSHLVELVSEPDTKKLLSCKCFDAQMKNGNPVYSYELQEGVSSMRLGVTILENEKVFDLLRLNKQEI